MIATLEPILKNGFLVMPDDEDNELQLQFRRAQALIQDIVAPDSTLVTARHLLTTGAYKIKLNEDLASWPLWKSGIRAPVYCDCRSLLGNHHVRRVVAQELARAVTEYHPDVDLIIGVATAGIAWSALVAEQLNLPQGYVRTTVKTHGIGNLIEGWPAKQPAKAVLIDDLVASGGSLRNVIDSTLARTSVQIVGIQSIVNWGFADMFENLGGMSPRALTSYPFILRLAYKQQLISASQCSQLLNFYQNPTAYDWDSRA